MNESSEALGVNVDYYGYKSLVLENEALRVNVTPQVGAKIVSLYDKRTAREWLITPEQSNEFRAWPYGAEYNPNQCGGWDEMIPTILACPYPAEGPLRGTPLPDHGEAWTLPWQDTGSTGAEIALELTGRALPYRLRRVMSVQGAALALSYTLMNESDAPLACLWAAHPQFACDPGATIVLPDSVTEVVNVLPVEWGPEFGTPGTRNPWPSFDLGARELPQDPLAAPAVHPVHYVHPVHPRLDLRQDQVAGPEKHAGRKFYIPPGSPISWGELRQPSGECLRMSWDSRFAPYCGVWIDEGYLNQVSDMAFEPTNGYYDSLAAAWDNQRCTVLAPRSAASWELHVRLSIPATGRPTSGAPGGELA